MSNAAPSDIDLSVSDSDPPPSVLRGFGWKKDEPDPRDRSARVMLGAPTALPAEVLRMLPHSTVRNQKQTSECVGFAFSNAILIALRMLVAMVRAQGGVEPEPKEPSEQGIYTLARVRERKRKGDKLIDAGCFPRDAAMALREDGAPSADEWPFDPAKVNEDLPWDAEQMAAVARCESFYKIDSDGIARVHDIMNAVNQDYPVPFGMFVDAAYMQLADDSTVMDVDTSDPQGGGHMQCIIGYRTRVDGTIEFLVLNQWGTDWGWNGLAWIHQSVIVQSYASDFYAMRVVLADAPQKAKES